MKKNISMLLSATMILTMLAGCSKSSSEPASEAAAPAGTTAVVETPAPAETPAATEGAEPVKELSGTVEFWSNWNEGENNALIMKEAAEAFQELHPDVTINFTFNGRDNRNLVGPAIESGTQIDIMDCNIVDIKSRWSDYITDVSEYLTQTYDTTGGRPYNEYVMPAFMALLEKEFDGVPKAIPYCGQTYAIYCNKSIFDEVGITAYPATWDELLDACAKIKEAGYIPITTDTAYGTSWFAYYVTRLMGEEAVQELANDSSKWDDPRVLEAAKAIEELAKLGYYDPNLSSNVYPTAQQNIVVNENIAMEIVGNYVIEEVKATTPEDFQWGTFAFPAVENGLDGTEAGCYGTYGMALNKNSDPEVMDAAAAFAIFLSSGEYDQKLAHEGNTIPMGKEVEWPETLQSTRDVMMNYTKNYKAQTALVTNADSKPIIRDACVRLMAGEITAEEFIKQASDF